MAGGFSGLIYFILFVVIMVMVFKTNVLAGLALLLVITVFYLYAKRAAIFAFIGRIAYGKGSMQDALKWFERAYKTGVAKPQTIVSYGYLLLKSGNIEEAENILERLSRRSLSENDRMVLKSNMALVQWKKGNLDEAISTLEEVIKKYETTNIYGSLGYMLIQKGDLDKALEFNLKASEYNSSSPIIMDNLANTYYLRGNYDKAAEIYENLMESNPTFPEAYYNYALVLKAKKEYTKALETVKKALNYQLTFLSTITKSQIDNLISELENLCAGE
ncbi:MAG TPA: tetratricopeptide repeat protein [Clostridiaceae bacterium]|nr:tetratricopeptide repeat protein [Clostridiaceae bacterium]